MALHDQSREKWEQNVSTCGCMAAVATISVFCLELYGFGYRMTVEDTMKYDGGV